MIPRFRRLWTLSDVLVLFWKVFQSLWSLLRLLYVRVYLPVAEYWLDCMLGVSEEFVKAIIRESFHHLIRFINGLFAWIVSVVDKASRLYYRTQTGRHSCSGSRWENLRPSGLNWIVESETAPYSPSSSAAGRPSVHPQPLTVEHFIAEAGYPLESHEVATDDGYILYLHRLPRPDAKRTVFFQHGVLDTSLGWVCSGVTDSLPFAAWDQGCDVWLGNSRSNPPRKHIDPDLGRGKYWRYTLNELGMKDVSAQLNYIHHIKCNEAVDVSQSSGIHTSKSEGSFDSTAVHHGSDGECVPYALIVVGHSLGAAALLIYVVTSLYYGRRHRIKRMVLMSPAGFHPVYPIVVYPLIWILPPLVWILERVFGRKGAALMIPGYFARLFVFKILRDAMQYPAVTEFFQRGIRWLMSGDVSPWDFVMQLPHYDAHSMPGISMHSGIHLIQMVRAGKFQLYDHGSVVRNQIHYGQSTPLDVAAEYGRIDIPVDIVAGRNDGVIPPRCVRMHVDWMTDKGVDVSYREFDYGHLEFSATVGHDLQDHVLEMIERTEG